MKKHRPISNKVTRHSEGIAKFRSYEKAHAQEKKPVVVPRPGEFVVYSQNQDLTKKLNIEEFRKTGILQSSRPTSSAAISTRRDLSPQEAMFRNPSMPTMTQDSGLEDLTRQNSARELPSLTNQLRAIRKPQNSNMLESSSLAMIGSSCNTSRPATASLIKSASGNLGIEGSRIYWKQARKRDIRPAPKLDYLPPRPQRPTAISTARHRALNESKSTTLMETKKSARSPFLLEKDNASMKNLHSSSSRVVIKTPRRPLERPPTASTTGYSITVPLNDVLKDEKEVKFLPLELYDPKDDAVNPEKFLAAKREQYGENIPGFSKWFYPEGTFSWEPCVVEMHDSKSDRYLIRWPSGKTKQVSRLNLRFEGENTYEYNARREEAEKHRDRAELILRYNIVIDNIKLDISMMSVRMTDSIVQFVKGRIAEITEDNFRQPLKYYSLPASEQQKPHNHLWTSWLTHNLVEPFRKLGLKSPEELRERFFKRLKPFKLAGHSQKDIKYEIDNTQIKAIFQEIDADYKRSAAVFEFELDLPFNEEKREQFGSLIDQSKFLPINERFRKATDTIGVVEKLNYDFLPRVKKINEDLHLSFPDSLAILRNHYAQIAEFSDEFFLYPQDYIQQQDLGKLDRMIRVTSIDTVRELRNTIFDTQYEINDVLTTANQERIKRNETRLATKAYADQYVYIEDSLPEEFLTRMKRLMSLCNITFERCARECLEKSLTLIDGQFNQFIELLEDSLRSKIPAEIEADQFVGVYANVSYLKPVKFRPTIKCKLKFGEAFVLVPDSEKCVDTILDTILASFENCQRISCLENNLLGSVREDNLLKVMEMRDEVIEEYYEGIKQKLYGLARFPECLLEWLNRFTYVSKLNAKQYKEKYSKDVKLSEYEKDLKFLHNTLRDLKLLLFYDDKLHFGLFEIDIKSTKTTVIAKVQKCFDVLVDCLMVQVETQVSTTENQHEEVKEIIGHDPENLEELDEMKKFLGNPYDDRVHFIKKNMSILSRQIDLLEQYQLRLEPEVFGRAVSCYATIRRLARMKRSCETGIRRCQKIFAVQLQRSQVDMLDKVDEIFEEIQELKKEHEYENGEDISFKYGVLKQKIEDSIAEAKLINMREGLVGARPTNYRPLDSYKREFMPFCKLWFFVKDFKTHHPRWMKGSFGDLKRDDLQDEITTYEIELTKLERTTFKDNWAGTKVAKALQADVAKFKPYMPLIIALRNPGLKDRHWEEISKLTSITLNKNMKKVKLVDLIERGIMEFVDEISDISDRATRELALENAKHKMETEWEHISFQVVPFKETGTYIIVENQPIWDLLDDHLMKTQSMCASPYVKFMEKEMNQWRMGLVKTQEIIDHWEYCQKMWMYLSPIFSQNDITNKLPAPSRQFKLVDTTWESIMSTCQMNPLVQEVCIGGSSTVLVQLKFCNENLDSIMKSLNEWLNSKREVFPRFYFLANDELLQILSNAVDVKSVNKYMVKCFEGINSLIFDEELKITGMISPEGEQVDFLDCVETFGLEKNEFNHDNLVVRDVELWLVDVEKEMVKTIQTLIRRCIEDSKVNKRRQWIQDWPAQMVHVVNNTLWTSQVEHAIQMGIKGIDQLQRDLEKQLNKIVEMVRNDLSVLDRLTLGTLVILDVFNKDTVQDILDKNVRDVRDFEWLAQFRYYQEGSKLVAKMIETEREYGYEYLGNQTRLVITPLTVRCYRTLMGALYLNLGGAPEGPAGTGKTETTKDLAKSVGKKCIVFNCSDRLDHVSMAKMFIGIACCGAWACFDEFNRIELEVLSVIAEQILCIQTACVKKQRSFQFDEQIIPLTSSFAIFITMNPGYAGRSELPDNLKALFRPVAMMMPESTMIAQIQLYSYGFKIAPMLAVKLVTCLRLASEQLSQQHHYDYSLRAIITIVKTAGQFKRQDVNEDESKMILRAIKDTNISKFMKHDIPLFEGIVTDLFPDVEPASDSYEVENAVKMALMDSGLDYNEFMCNKIRQLYVCMQVRHGIMLVGEAMSSKTTVIELLKAGIRSYEKEKEPALPQNFFAQLAARGDSTDRSKKKKRKYVQSYVINPKAVNLSELYGEMDPISHDWMDGLISYRVRECAEKTEKDLQWIVFDGPVDAIWIESMNTVLDDNKKLCLTSGEIIQLTAQMSLLFEVHNLISASPATVSRCGMIYLEASESLSWRSLLMTWINDMPVMFDTDCHKEFIGSLFEYFLPEIVECTIKHQNRAPIKTSTNWLVNSFIKVFESMILGDETRESMEQRIADEQEREEVKRKEMELRIKRDEGKTDLRSPRLSSFVVGMVNKSEFAALAINQAVKKSKGSERIKIANRELELEERQQLMSKFMFAITWSFGCIFDEKGRQAFSEVQQGLFKRATGKGEDARPLACLHKCDQSYHKRDVFDMFYDEKGRWLGWKDVLDLKHLQATNINTLVVPTVDTLRYNYLLNHVLTNDHHVLITGATGTGKTVIIRKLLSGLDPINYMSILTMLSGQATSSQTQDIIDSRINKRKKGVYGPEYGKKCMIFIDDLNMPASEVSGAQPAIEILRQAIDKKAWYDRKNCQLKLLEDLVFIGAMGHPGGGRNHITARFMHHFILINATEFSGETLESIFGTILDLGFENYQEEIQLHAKHIAVATINLYQGILTSLPPTPTKSHYTFNLRDLSGIILGILSCPNTQMINYDMLLKLWIHECQRVFEDRLINDEDREILHNSLIQNLDTYLKVPYESLCREGAPFFCNFLGDEVYQECPDMAKAKESLEIGLDEYNIKAPVKMNLVLFKFAIEHVARISRVIAHPYGNALLIGIGGTGRQSLSKLASIMMRYDVFSIEITKSYGIPDWKEDLKSLMMKAGVGNKKITFIITDSHIKHDVFLENINSIINSGEVPNLFNNEEKELILDRMLEKRGMSIKNELERWDEFIQCIRLHLHVVLCFSPIGDTLRNRLRKFPSLVSCCVIDWFSRWPVEALRDVAVYFFDLNKLCPESDYDDAVAICSHFHKTVIDLSVRFKEEQRRYNYVTPTNYLQLLETIKNTLAYKKETSIAIKKKYEKGVLKLDEAQSVVANLKIELERQQPILKESSTKTMELMKVIEQQQAEADITRESVFKEQEIAAAETEVAEELRNECEAVLSGALPELEAAITALKTLKKSDIDEVKAMSKPPIGVELTLKAVAIITSQKPARIRDKNDNTRIVLDYYGPGKKLLANPKFLQKLEKFDRENIPANVITQLQPFIENERWTPDLVRKASKAAEGLCKWIRAMVNFYDINNNIKPKKDALKAAKQELDDKFCTLQAKKDDLERVEKEIDTLRSRFEKENELKSKLMSDIKDCETKLLRAETLTEKLGGERDRWDKIAIQMGGEIQNIFCDVLLSAGTISYLGAFESSYRQDIISNSWIPFVKATNIPCASDFSLRNVLGDSLTIQKWIIQGLPDDSTSIENAIMIERSDKWPLIIDPQKQANKWIRKSNSGKNVAFTKPANEDFVAILENAIFTGAVLLLENVGETLDPVLDPLLDKQIETKAGVSTIKIGDTYKQYDRDFRLYMTSNLPNPQFSPEISTKVTILNFTITKQGLREQLRTLICEQECPKETQEKQRVTISASENRKILMEQEEKILALLQSTQGNLLDDEVVINSLTECKTISIDVEKKLKSAKIAEKRIEEIQETYNEVAIHGSVLYFTVADLTNIEFMYEFSLEWFATQYKKAISKAERTKDIEKRCGNLIRKFRRILFDSVCSSLFEKDKLQFSFLICVRLLEEEGKLDQAEWKYFLNGFASGEHKVPETPEGLSSQLWNTVCQAATLPFLSTLPQHVMEHVEEWKAFISAPADPMTTSDLSELASTLPAPYNDPETCSMMQWLVLIRVFSSELVIPAVRSFIKSYIGEKFLNFPLFNINMFHEESTYLTPLIFILSPGNDPYSVLQKFAAENKKHLQTISLGKGQGERAEKVIRETAINGGWVLLQNCHLAPSWMSTLEGIIEKLGENRGTREETALDFRLWLTCLPTPSFPVSILQTGLKMIIEPPKGIRSNMERIYKMIHTSKEDMLFYNSCTKEVEWRKLFFGLSFFHTLIRERRKFGPLGWNNIYEFNDSDLRISMRQLNVMLSKYDKIPYSALLYLTGECNYGGRVTDDFDGRTLNHILTDFYNDNILYDHYKFCSLPNYYAPPDSNDIIDYERFIEDFPKIDSTEIFGLHENASITLARKETSEFFSALQLIQPRKTASSQDEREEVLTISEKILTIVSVEISEDFRKSAYASSSFGWDRLFANINPTSFNVALVQEKYPVIYEQSMNTVLIQELNKFNNLIAMIKTSLVEINEAMAGVVVITNELEKLGQDLINHRVPTMWSEVAYPSRKSLLSWTLDLQARLLFFKDWIENGPPSVYWISGFFFTESFLTGTLQNYARKTRLPIDTLEFEIEVRSDILPSEDTNFRHVEPPEDGCYIHGLFLEGAEWDALAKVLKDPSPRELFYPMFPIWLKPVAKVVEKGVKKPLTYECPVYKTSLRTGKLLNSGSSTNFVMSIKLPSKDPEKNWVKRGVALLTQLDD